MIRMAGTVTSAEDAATVAVGSACSLIVAWVMVRWVPALLIEDVGEAREAGRTVPEMR